MFEKLRQKSLHKLIEKNLDNRDVSQRNNAMKTLGFLIDEATFIDFDKIHKLSKEFNIQYKDLKIYSFKEVKKKLPTLVQNQVNNKDFSWKGVINNKNATEFLEIPFDVLVGYYNTNNSFLNLMVSKSKAKFKVGFKGTDPRVFDLLLDVKPQEFENFKAELKKYLKVLNKI
jgi:hypothetical protein